jgi:MFS family permease
VAAGGRFFDEVQNESRVMAVDVQRAIVVPRPRFRPFEDERWLAMALLMPMMISMVLASITTGQLISRTGRFKIFGLFGLAAAALGMYLLSTIGVNTSNGAVVGAMILIGSGIGVTMPLFTISLQSQFQTRIGEVTGALQFFRSIGGTVGVALLGGVMNAAFSDSLTALVARDAAKFGPAAALLGKLTAEPGKLLNQGALAAVAAKIPAEAQAVFTRFLIDVKIALAAGVSDAFFWAFIMMSLAFVAMFFVREVPLSAHPRLDSAAEIGTEILAEEAVQPAEHEPVIVDADSESPDEERAG